MTIPYTFGNLPGPIPLSDLDANFSYVSNSANTSYNQGSTGSVTRTIQNKLQESVSVKDFGAKGDGVTDDTTAIQAALNNGGGSIYFPKGIYLCNVIITNKIIICGDGSTTTIIKPYNNTIACFTYQNSGNYWSYHSEIRNIGFQGNGGTGASATGVGFTFGQTNPANYVAGQEYCNNVKFYGCRFLNLYQGVQFPFGNIGTEFYSCGWSGCYYGVYTINNKYYPSVSGSDAMHAGNKYFYAGQFDSCQCAVYINNSLNGFGAICFKDTIFEYNNIGVYLSQTNTNAIVTPLSFINVWFEGNGQANASISSNVNLDVWTGTTKTTSSFVAHTIYLDGANIETTIDSGISADIYIAAINARLVTTNTRILSAPGDSTPESIVVSNTSEIIHINPSTDWGFGNADKVLHKGNLKFVSYLATETGGKSFARFAIVTSRWNKQTLYGGSGISLTGGSTIAYTGTVSGIGSVISDGVIFSTCNQFSLTFSGTQFEILTGSSLSVTANYWVVCTFDVKWVSGVQPIFLVGDLNLNQIASFMQPSVVGKWFTYACIAQSPNAFSSFVTFGNNGVSGASVFNMSAIQQRQFTTKTEALNFIDSMTYVY
jgi:hypothetical protein